jgi:large subunit ribosomal protein L19
MDKLKLAEQTLINDEYPEFKAGDTVNVHYRVREGDKERIQQYEGLVISRKGSGANKTFIVRKISAGNIGVERVFPLYSPFIAKIELKKQGEVRRSKLYYLRDRRGKAARIKEKGQNQNNVRELNRQAEAKAEAAREAKASAEEE